MFFFWGGGTHVNPDLEINKEGINCCDQNAELWTLKFYKGVHLIAYDAHDLFAVMSQQKLCNPGQLHKCFPSSEEAVTIAKKEPKKND